MSYADHRISAYVIYGRARTSLTFRLVVSERVRNSDNKVPATLHRKRKSGIRGLSEAAANILPVVVLKMGTSRPVGRNLSDARVVIFISCDSIHPTGCP